MHRGHIYVFKKKERKQKNHEKFSNQKTREKTAETHKPGCTNITSDAGSKRCNSVLQDKLKPQNQQGYRSTCFP